MAGSVQFFKGFLDTATYWLSLLSIILGVFALFKGVKIEKIKKKEILQNIGDGNDLLPEENGLRINTPFSSSGVYHLFKGISYIFPKYIREAWFGDIFEVKSNMQKEGYRTSIISFVLFLKVIILFYAGIKIRFSDYLNPEKSVSSNEQK